MTGDPRTAVAGRRLRKQVSPTEGLARRREGGPFPGHSRGLRRAQDSGAQAHRLQCSCRRSSRAPASPHRASRSPRRGTSPPTPSVWARRSHARPRCQDSPPELGPRLGGVGSAPGGGGCCGEDSHWGTRNLAAGPPPRPPAPRPLGNRGLCDWVPPVGQLTGHSGVRACDPGGDPAVLTGPTAEAPPQEPSPWAAGGRGPDAALVTAGHCSRHPRLGHVLGPPLGQRGPQPLCPVLPGHTQARRSPLLLLPFGRRAHSGDADRGSWGWQRGWGGRGQPAAGARTPGGRRAGCGASWCRAEQSGGAGCRREPPPLAGSLGQRTGL